MNFTVANHNSATNPNNFIHYDSVEFSDIPQMATSGSCYCACKLKNNYRADNNFDGSVDVLIIDIDEDCTIEQAKVLFKRYEFFIITSKSHQKEKNGIVCDRFRIFFKLDKTINIRQEMEEIYSLFIDKYPFVDTSCRNVSRFFYSSPFEAEVIYNKGIKYKTKIPICVNPMGVEDTNGSKEVSLPKVRGIYVLDEITGLWTNEFNEVLVDDNQNDTTLENKLKGGIALLDKEFYSGNRNNAIFSCACMLLKDGLSEQEVVDFITEENDKRDSISFNEAMYCIKSALRTI